MQTVIWNKLDRKAQLECLQRPAIESATSIEERVLEVKNAILEDGDKALYALTQRFDNVTLDALTLNKERFSKARNQLTDEFKAALSVAYENIYEFHEAQKPQCVDIETTSGVRCEVLTRPIEKVGLYIPGGTAPLFSTVLMLAIPAKIAGCKRIVLATPPNVADEIIYAAELCGIDTIYTVGGAQAVFALGFGTETVEKVDKIFGPGNSYVTEAKKQVSQLVGGASIDMPAGPSEVLVIADSEANPAFVASDLLSQAEHGEDSQVVLVTTSKILAECVEKEVIAQLSQLSRKEVAQKSLMKSVSIIAESINEAIAISNLYAPEHLIIQTQEPRLILDKIQNAGSVFLGAYSPESVGDYASGTNHVLPTYGYARTYSSLGLADFYKRMTVQELTKEGLEQLGPMVSLLAEKECLDAHKMAVDIRLDSLRGS